MTDVVIAGTLLASVGAGIWLFTHSFDRDLLSRFLLAVLPAMLVIVLGVFVARFVNTDLWHLNALRLTPSFALVRGYQLYYGAGEGPVLDYIYGPITALVYLPAVVANSPIIALVVAQLISVALFFIPILWLHTGCHPELARPTLPTVYAFIWFCLVTFYSRALSYSAFAVHADAPALGLGAGACAVLYRHDIPPGFWRSLLSAGLAVLAIATKQTMLALPLALSIYVLAVSGWRSFVDYLFCLGATCAVLGAILLSTVDVPAFLFNVVTLPASFPIEATKRWVGTFLAHMCWPLIIVAFVLVADAVLVRRPWRGPRSYIKDHRWLLFVLVGVSLMPEAYLGSVKFGGDVNSFSLSIYFLWTAVTLGLSSLSSARSTLNRDMTRKWGAALLASVAALFSLVQAPSIRDIDASVASWPVQRVVQAYDYARRNPGEMYFPDQPLSVLMAEGKLYHFLYGVYDREVAGLAVTEAHLRAHIPPHVTLVDCTRHISSAVEKLLPEFSRRISVEDLPGWTVCAKP